MTITYLRPTIYHLRGRARPRHGGLLIALLLMTITSAAGLPGQAPGPPSATPQKEEATTSTVSRRQSIVRGRVVYEDTGRPLRRVQVILFDPGNRSARSSAAWTDGRGDFLIKNLAAGKYYISVDAPGVIRPVPVGAPETMKDLTTVAVDGTNNAEVRVRVRRGGAISGKVTYPDGDPAMNTSISLWRKQDGQLTPVFIGGGLRNSPVTDERGMYRVSGLAPGEYVVGAAEQKMEIEDQEDERGGRRLYRAALGATYYPATPNSRNATALRVNAGEEVTNIDITLVERSTHSLSGTVTWRGSGRPVARARVSITSRDELHSLRSSPDEHGATTDEQGRWTLQEVPEGNHLITVAPLREFMPREAGSASAQEAKAPERRGFAVKQQEVTVTGSDLTGLSIEVTEGGRLSGTVSVEGGQPLPREMMVVAEPVGGSLRMPRNYTSAMVRADGTFTLDGLPSGGLYLQAVGPTSDKYYTKSVTANGVDLLREPLKVEDGTEVTGVRLVISTAVGTLTGRVLSASDQTPVRGAGVVLIPADADQQRRRRTWLSGMTNAAGMCTVSGAPGEYLVTVWRAGTNLSQLTEEAIRARTTTAQRVTLQAGERKSLDIVAPEP